MIASHIQESPLLQRHYLTAGNSDGIEASVAAGQRIRQRRQGSIVQATVNTHIGVLCRGGPLDGIEQRPHIAAEAVAQLKGIIPGEGNTLSTRTHVLITIHIQAGSRHIIQHRAAVGGDVGGHFRVLHGKATGGVDVVIHRASRHGQRAVVVDVVIHRHATERCGCSGTDFQTSTGIQRTACHFQLSVSIQVYITHANDIRIGQLQPAARADVEFVGRRRARDGICHFLILCHKRAVHIQCVPVLHLQAHPFLQRCRLTAGNAHTIGTLVPTGKSVRQSRQRGIIQRAINTHIGILCRCRPLDGVEEG